MSASFTSSQSIAATLSDSVLNAKPGEFYNRFNRSPFEFSHNLAGHPLFEIPRLVELANFLLKTGGTKKVRCGMSNNPVYSKWSDMPLKEQVAEAIATIDKSESWVVLYNVQDDPQYNALLDQIISELEILTGVPLTQDITWLDAYIFIASPQAITPYHIDHESTFLFQIHGDRTANLFDPYDRSILSEQEIEQYYTGNLEAATYHEEKQKKAYVYPITPGTGVHHPSRAPHWYKNGSDYSVAIGVHFCLRSCDQEAKIYQVNHFLRKFKLQPSPPGQSRWQDRFKIFLMEMLSKRQPKTKDELLRSGVRRIHTLIQLKLLSKILKKLVGVIAKKTPLISDYYHYYWCFPRHLTACRGTYRSFSEAMQAISSGVRAGYNQPEIHDESVRYLTASYNPGEFNSRDYPILVWLQSAFTENNRVFDLGGNIGLSYYAYKKFIPYPEGLKWIVCEIEEIAKAGEAYAGRTPSLGLSYTTNFLDAKGVNILLTCGTLQYLDTTLADLLSHLQPPPSHLLINRIPLYDGETFFTLQNIGYAYTPYRIQNHAEFVSSLTSLGYELIDSWQDQRTLSIPFHPKHFVSGYYGFYFRRKSADKAS